MITRVNVPWAFIEWSGPAVWAEAHGLSGSEDEGWRGWVRIDELANVGVIESDHRLPLP